MVFHLYLHDYNGKHFHVDLECISLLCILHLHEVCILIFCNSFHKEFHLDFSDKTLVVLEKVIQGMEEVELMEEVEVLEVLKVLYLLLEQEYRIGLSIVCSDFCR